MSSVSIMVMSQLMLLSNFCNYTYPQLPPQFYIAVSSSSSGVHKTTPPDHSKGPQATMHPVVQLRAPTVAAPAVPPRMLPATPPNICSRGLSVTPPPVQMCTHPPVPVATPPPIAAPGSSSCWIKAFKIPDFSFRTQQAWSQHQRGQQRHCNVHSPPHMDPHQVPNV